MPGPIVPRCCAAPALSQLPVTHNHPEGVRGAQATAAAIYLARRVQDKNRIRETIESQFGYNLSTPIERIRPTYCFDETGQGTVPQALTAFLESDSYEDAIATLFRSAETPTRSRASLEALLKPTTPAHRSS